MLTSTANVHLWSAVQRLKRTWRAYEIYHAYAEYKIKNAAIIGTICFPAFYFWWAKFSPQPYENIGLRVIGTTLCAFLAISNFWPHALKKYQALFSYLTFIYCLPLFFSFMLLMNGGTTEWWLSSLAALVYLVFLIDSKNVALASSIGIALGVFFYLVTSDHPRLPSGSLSVIPILIFYFVGMILLNHSNNVIAAEQIKAASALAGYIAHEMRTPLASIRLDAQSTSGAIVQLINAYQFARSKGYEGAPIREGKMELLSGSCDRIAAQAMSANAVIDALLLNISGLDCPTPSDGKHSIKTTVETVIEKYIFKPEERRKIHLKSTADFLFQGSEELMRHVIFNIIRNALRATEKLNGVVIVEIESGQLNKISFTDNGIGVDPELAKKIFLPFYTSNHDSGGTGLGLAFCRLVVEEGMNGAITCSSNPGQGTTFAVHLPPIV